MNCPHDLVAATFLAPGTSEVGPFSATTSVRAARRSLGCCGRHRVDALSVSRKGRPWCATSQQTVPSHEKLIATPKCLLLNQVMNHDVCSWCIAGFSVEKRVPKGSKPPNNTQTSTSCESIAKDEGECCDAQQCINQRKIRQRLPFLDYLWFN